MIKPGGAAGSLSVNSYAAHRDEVLMRERRRFRARHKTLVSFASTFYFEEGQRRLVRAAAASGEFDTIENWSPDRIRQEPFYQAHRDILDRSKGAGNWAWKPYIVAKAVAGRRDGDFVVYTDAGMQAVDDEPLPSIVPLLTWLDESDRRIAAATLHGYRQGAWTRRDCFVLMGCDEERYWNLDQVQASYLAFMVSPETRRLAEEWLRYASDARVICDGPNTTGLPNLDGFVDHRYDQSILTNLVHKHGLEVPTDVQPSKKIKTLIGELDRGIVRGARPSANLALGKPWSVSSRSPWSAETGIYGERQTGGLPFFFHTGLDDRPWFVLDLGTVRTVSEIRIYNRWDEYGDRAQNLRVWLGRTEAAYDLVFDAVDAHWHPGHPLFLRFDNAAFRFLKIDLDEEQHLHLDGIEIFAAAA